MDTERAAPADAEAPTTNGTSSAANSGPAIRPETQPAAGDGLGRHALALGLSALLGFAGVAHFVRPEFFDAIVPEWMPGEPRTTTYVSGAVELTAAALVAVPRTRRFGGWFAAATFLGVLPANVQAALDGGMDGLEPPFDSPAVAWARLPLQLPLIAWAVAIARGGRTHS
ncbi:MAG: hypothetical protein KDB24_15855 [Microthrixaceae bacterium]|nr:hypothetical protein [Microthrixaceae bacterium]